MLKLFFKPLTFFVLFAFFPRSIYAAQMVSTAAAEDYAEASYVEAMKLRGRGDLLKAERLIHEALSQSPENYFYQFELSNVYAAKHDALRKQRRYDEARQMLQSVITALEHTVMLKESYIPAQYNLGVSYKRLGEFEKAREKMRSLIDYSKKNNMPQIALNAWLQMGSIYEEQSFFHEAREAYLQAKEYNYYDHNVENALRDLDLRETQKKLEAQRQAGLESYSRRIEMTSFAQLTGQEPMQRQESMNGAAALPFLGVMLVQQFLNRKANKDEEF